MNRIEEKEAYIVLQCLWEDFSNDFYSSESPDLKNDTQSIGIEITQSTLDMKDRMTFIANKMHIRPNKESRHNLEIMAYYDKDNFCEEFEQQIKEKTKEELVVELFENTKQLISTKTNKFQKTYSKYKTNGLFVFIRTYELSIEFIKDICDHFKHEQDNHRDKIDILFLHNIDNLYIYNRITGILNTIYIDEDTKNIIYNIL